MVLINAPIVPPAVMEDNVTQNASARTLPPPPPVLVLKPLNGTFMTKVLDISSGLVKIGRKMNTKQGSERDNGIFDSKVLSRSHAEIWLDSGKVWIKDVGSSNGTFVNGKRLSEEGSMSEPVEIVSGDELIFGIDIATDDPSAGTFQKVACLVKVADPSDVPAPSPVREKLSDSQRYGVPRLDSVLNIIEDGIRRASDAGVELDHIKSTLADLDSIVNKPNGFADPFAHKLGKAAPQSGGDSPERAHIPAKSPAPDSIELDETKGEATLLLKLESERKAHEAALSTINVQMLRAAEELALTKKKLDEQIVLAKRLQETVNGSANECEELKGRFKSLEIEMTRLLSEKESQRLELTRELESWKTRALKAEGDADMLTKKEAATLKATAAATQAQKDHLESLEREISRLKTEQLSLVEEATKEAILVTRQAATAEYRNEIRELRGLVESSQASENSAKTALVETRARLEVVEGLLNIAESEKTALKVKLRSAEDLIAASKTSDGNNAKEPSHVLSSISSGVLRNRKPKGESNLERASTSSAKPKKGTTADSQNKIKSSTDPSDAPTVKRNPTRDGIIQAILYLGCMGLAAVGTYILVRPPRD
ncbi:hypothetical protein DFJ73DRAFT_660905 [Zopfochytrium polystomum]|nr:hypothetical protein DFJ73DRAFT_660905 [Zopfochytrium polystomum]